MLREATDPSDRRRPLAAALTAVILLSLAVYLARVSISLAMVGALRPVAQMAAPRDEQQLLLTLPDDDMRRAMAGRPLDQSVFNVALVRNLRSHGDAELMRWNGVLSRMGWRDNPALWNGLYVATQTENVRQLVDIGDALLRRRQMLDQLIPVLVAAESDDRTRPMIVDRLVGRPNWRDAYLKTATAVTTSEQIVARYRTLSALRSRGSQLSTGEAGTNAIAFDRGGRPDLGYALWSSTQAGMASPLNDPDFKRIGIRTGNDAVVPYEWEIFNGDGYSTDAFIDAGRAMLEIRWNGRGVPIFARQRTTARKGGYNLQVGVLPDSLADLRVIGFRFICGNVAIPLRQDSQQPNQFVTSTPVSCDYPLIEITGDIQAAATPRQLVLYGLHLHRTDTAKP